MDLTASAASLAYWRIFFLPLLERLGIFTTPSACMTAAILLWPSMKAWASAAVKLTSSLMKKILAVLISSGARATVWDPTLNPFPNTSSTFCSFSLMVEAAKTLAPNPKAIRVTTKVMIVFFIFVLPFLGAVGFWLFFFLVLFNRCFYCIIFLWLGVWWFIVSWCIFLLSYGNCLHSN